MSGYIPEEIIERVRESADITQIISQFVKLKRRGQNFIGLCPFHQEKTPSFTVSPGKQIFHCFGCGQGGNVFSFMMEHEKMTFPEAVRHLATKSGIEVPEQAGAGRNREETEKLQFALSLAQDYFASTLREDKYRKVYHDYLQGARKISAKTIEEFSLGLSPESSGAFVKHAQSKGLTPEILIKAGLAGRGDRDNDYYDRFRRRLMFPIHNLSDKTIAFGGRALRKEENAKYINSPETPLYSKSAVLYGLNMTRDAIREAGSVIIVEGYFDVISLWQVGVKNVVASSGTAFTNQQGRLLKRFADKAYLFFDADSAGVKAAIRSVDALYNSGVEVMVISAPEGEDPDSMSQQGPEAIQKLLTSADRYLQFRLRRFDSANAGLVERNEFIGDLAAVAARISDPALKALFIAEAAEGVGVSADLFAGKSAKAPAYQDPNEPDQAKPRKSGASLSEDDWGARGARTIEAEMLSLLLSFPTLIDQASERIGAENFKSPRLKELFTEMTEYFAHGSDASLFVGSLEDAQLRETASLLLTRRWENESPGTTLSDYLDKIISISETRPNINALKLKLKAAESAGNSAETERLTEELMRHLSH